MRHKLKLRGVNLRSSDATLSCRPMQLELRKHMPVYCHGHLARHQYYACNCSNSPGVCIAAAFTPSKSDRKSKEVFFTGRVPLIHASGRITFTFRRSKAALLRQEKKSLLQRFRKRVATACRSTAAPGLHIPPVHSWHIHSSIKRSTHNGAAYAASLLA